MLRPREWRRLMDVPLPLELLPLMTDAPAPVSAVALVVGGTGGGVVTLTGASVWSTEDLKNIKNIKVIKKLEQSNAQLIGLHVAIADPERGRMSEYLWGVMGLTLLGWSSSSST